MRHTHLHWSATNKNLKSNPDIPEQYVGSVDSNDKPHGYGLMCFPDGEKHFGLAIHGKLVGKAITVFPRGDQHEGDVEIGKGTYRHANGFLYEGDTANRIPNGKGIMWISGGGKYTGDFLDGLFHGDGMCEFFSDSLSYKGRFVNGKPHGSGALTFHRMHLDPQDTISSAENCELTIDGFFDRTWTPFGECNITMPTGSTVKVCLEKTKIIRVLGASLSNSVSFQGRLEFNADSSTFSGEIHNLVIPNGSVFQGVLNRNVFSEISGTEVPDAADEDILQQMLKEFLFVIKLAL